MRTITGKQWKARAWEWVQTEPATIPVRILENTDKSPFWYTSNKFKARYHHEDAHIGDNFYDGNNGDKWEVLDADPKNNRLFVVNLSQGGACFVVWGSPFQD